MESKIEKIDHIDCITYRNRAILEEDITIVTEGTVSKILQKQNEIIDYLNSQDQGETCTHDFDLNNRCTKCGVRGVKDMIAELQDTPEEWEDRLTTGSLGESEYFRIDGEYVDDKETMVRFIKQLLDEREREVRKQERMIRLHKRVS